MEHVDTSSVHYFHTKPGVTMSFNLHPTTSTFKTDSVQQPTQFNEQATDDKFVANGPPSYSSLYSYKRTCNLATCNHPNVIKLWL